MGLWVDDDPDYDYVLTRTPRNGGESQHISLNRQVLSVLRIREHEWKSPVKAEVVSLTPKAPVKKIARSKKNV